MSKKQTLGVYFVKITTHTNEVYEFKVEAKTIFSASLFAGQLINHTTSGDPRYETMKLGEGYQMSIFRMRDIEKRSDCAPITIATVGDRHV